MFIPLYEVYLPIIWFLVPIQTRHYHSVCRAENEMTGEQNKVKKKEAIFWTSGEVHENYSWWNYSIFSIDYQVSYSFFFQKVNAISKYFASMRKINIKNIFYTTWGLGAFEPPILRLQDQRLCQLSYIFFSKY